MKVHGRRMRAAMLALVAGSPFVMVQGVGLRSAAALEPASQPTSQPVPQPATDAPATQPTPTPGTTTPAAPTQPEATPAAQEGTQPAAQPPIQPAMSSKAVPLPSTKVNDPTGFAADALVRLALLDLRSAGSPTRQDFAITQQLLSIAESMRPDDAELPRRRAEAAFNAGDSEGMLDATRRIVQLDPKDTVAQLRLITSRIAKEQTVDARLGLYEQFLGPKGASIDASVRSRLALDAALLLKERGDERGFVDRLKQACSLDMTNKDAALLALKYYNDRVGNTAGRVELLINLLMADPLDAQTHLSLAEAFAAEGVFDHSKRFHETAGRILQIVNQSDDPDRYSQSLVLSWLTNGPEEPIKEMTNSLLSQRMRIERAEEQGQTVTTGVNTVLRPEDIRLAEPMEKLRLCAALSMGVEGQEIVATSAVDLAKTMANRCRQYEDRTRWTADMTEERAAQLIRDIKVETQLWRMLAGVDLDLVEAELPALIEGLAPDDVRRAVPEVWRSLRKGEFEAVITRCDQIEQRSTWLLIAKAVALESTGKPAEACVLYREVWKGLPLTSLGALAVSLAEAAEPGAMQSEQSRQLRTLAERVPPWLDEMIKVPQRFQLLRADFVTRSANAMDRVEVQVRLRNLAPIPLSLGGGRGINTRMFFGPSIETGVRVRGDAASGEVFELDRRLRLLPNEEVVSNLWADGGLAGYIAELHSTNSARVRWRIIQGFEAQSDGKRIAGPGCQETSTATLAREALPEARLAPEALVRRIAIGTSDAELPSVLVACRAALQQLTPGSASDGAASQHISDALLAASEKWTPLGRFMAAAILPPVTQAPSLVALDQRLRQNAEPNLVAVILTTRVNKSDDPLLDECEKGTNPMLASLATRQRERLLRGTRLYATDGVEMATSATK